MIILSILNIGETNTERVGNNTQYSSYYASIFKLFNYTDLYSYNLKNIYEFIITEFIKYILYYLNIYILVYINIFVHDQM